MPGRLARAAAALGAAFIVATAAGLSAAGAAQARAEDLVPPDAEPTIVFTSSGVPPLTCATAPQVSGLSIASSTRVIIANMTGVNATLDVGHEEYFRVDNGAGLRLKLRPGQHELRLVPDCLVVTGTVAAVVTALNGQDAPDEPVPDRPSDDPTTLVEGPTTPTPATSGPATSAPTPSASTASGPTWGAPPPVSVPRSPAVSASGPRSASPAVVVTDVAAARLGAAESVVLDVDGFSLGASRDPKAGRLLAIIAAICVFGVTVAIIRAIVSQRTNSAVPL